MAKQMGAKSQVIYLPIDMEAQQERVKNRFVETPNETWQMGEAELNTWRTLFDEPDEAELSGLFLPDQPTEYTSWSAWAAKRWPSLPDEYA
jgi:hypothetical protein